MARAVCAGRSQRSPASVVGEASVLSIGLTRSSLIEPVIGMTPSACLTLYCVILIYQFRDHGSACAQCL